MNQKPLRRVQCLLAAVPVALALLSAAPPTQSVAQAAPGSPSDTPPMGWNSWNTSGCYGVNERVVRESAKAMVDKGMKAVGYEYVVVDDCWFDPERDADGNLRANPETFPSGMKALGDYIHSLGLKFGIYMVPMDETCAQHNERPPYPGSTGSLGNEKRDARTFASWGVDYLKYDWCDTRGSLEYQITQFTKMRDALRDTGRDIVYSINPNSMHAVTGDKYNWGEVADLWRTTEDVEVSWDTGKTNSWPMGVTNSLDVTAPLAAQNGPGHWNDPDMLPVGVQENGAKLDPTQNRSHFALWALMGAPLMAGNDIRTMSDEIRDILVNKRMVDVNQDPLGAGGRRVRDDGATEVFAKPLSNGDVAVGLINRGDATTTISTTATQIGLSGGSFTLTDLWSGAKTTTNGRITAEVPKHGIAVYRVSGCE